MWITKCLFVKGRDITRDVFFLSNWLKEDKAIIFLKLYIEKRKLKRKWKYKENWDNKNYT